MALNAGQVSVQPVDAGAQGVTTTNTPQAIGLFPVPPSTTVLAEIWVVARRPDTGSTKVWRFVASVKQNGSGSVSIEALQNFSAGGMVSAGDTTNMAGCSIGAFSDATNMGIQVTGPNGVTVNWIVAIDGWMLTD